jgi:hypothetical protein
MAWSLSDCRLARRTGIGEFPSCAQVWTSHGGTRRVPPSSLMSSAAGSRWKPSLGIWTTGAEAPVVVGTSRKSACISQIMATRSRDRPSPRWRGGCPRSHRAEVGTTHGVRDVLTCLSARADERALRASRQKRPIPATRRSTNPSRPGRQSPSPRPTIFVPPASVAILRAHTDCPTHA